MSSLTTARDLVYLKEMCGGRKLPPKSKMSKDQLAALYAKGVFKVDALDESNRLSSFLKADMTNTKRRMRDRVSKFNNAVKFYKTEIPRKISSIPDIVNDYRASNNLKHASNKYRRSAERYNKLRSKIGDRQPSRREISTLRKYGNRFTSDSDAYKKIRDEINNSNSKKFKNIEWLGRVAGAEKSLQKKFGDGTGYNNPEGK